MMTRYSGWVCRVLGVVVGLGMGAARAAGPDPAALDAAIQGHMQAADLVGLAAVALVDGKVVWQQGYGLADRRRGVPFTPDTVMNIGSISKTVVGVAMLQLVEDGRLDLDADVRTWLPFSIDHPHHPGAAITLRQLATHTSGISDRPAVYREVYHYGEATPPPLRHFLRDYLSRGGRHYAEANFLPQAPGRHREYSNIGAALAGYVVERAAGASLPRYTRSHVFGPLGMRRTRWALRSAHADHSDLHVVHNGMVIPIPRYALTTYPDGGVRTSAADLSALFGALLTDGSGQGRRILSPASVAELRRFQFSADQRPDNLDVAEKNSGLFWQSKDNVTRMGHGGNDPGIYAEMLTGLDRRIGVILLVNTSVEGPAMRHPFAIFEAVWAYAEALAGPASRP